MGVFWFSLAKVLPRGGCEGGLPDLRQFKEGYSQTARQPAKTLVRHIVRIAVNNPLYANHEAYS